VIPHPENLLKLNDINRIYHAKWHHSLVALDENTPIGILIAYERDRDEHYKNPTLYIAEIAIEKGYRNNKIGSKLIQNVIDQAKHHEYIKFESIKTISVQTNDDRGNVAVQSFYEKFGFIKTGVKYYDNRIDRIYTLDIP
jgi:ribosomal protein S18 acetylase RimI-like enzyme